MTSITFSHETYTFKTEQELDRLKWEEIRREDDYPDSERTKDNEVEREERE